MLLLPWDEIGGIFSIYPILYPWRFDLKKQQNIREIVRHISDPDCDYLSKLAGKRVSNSIGRTPGSEVKGTKPTRDS